ncbi:MAG TPA: flagellar biosynthetic protein FliQ [Bryobacteraceae bacterium]|nr:flagellar biosynthetic protein FliQ [Bryobacteraceae bacterium]
MTPEFVMQTVRQMLMMAFWVSAPLLIVGFVAGVAISLVQVVTSMQDSAFSTIPRLAAFLLALLISLPWILRQMMTYASLILGDLGRYAR